MTGSRPVRQQLPAQVNRGAAVATPALPLLLAAKVESCRFVCADPHSPQTTLSRLLASTSFSKLAPHSSHLYSNNGIEMLLKIVQRAFRARQGKSNVAELLCQAVQRIFVIIRLILKSLAGCYNSSGNDRNDTIRSFVVSLNWRLMYAHWSRAKIYQECED